MAMFDSSSSAGQVYKQMLRHVRAYALREGDLLPAQPAWQKTLGCGTVPFNDAMRLLETQGVVERRRRAGTRLLRAAPREKVPWTIAICAKLASEWHGGVSVAVLSQYLYALLQDAGCQVRIYNSDTPPRLHHELLEFKGFAGDVERGVIDGMVTMSRLMTCERERLVRHGVIECGIYPAHSAEASNESGLVLDQGPMIRQAVDLMAGRGARRIALLMAGSPWIPGKSYFERIFRETMAKHPHCVGLEWAIRGLVRGGAKMGRTLLDMPRKERPDALICTHDDYGALGLAHAIQADPAYRPAMAVYTNRQSPLPFPCPIHRFELDLMEVAAKSVRFLLDRLHAVDPRASCERVFPRLNEADAWMLPRFMMNWGRHARHGGDENADILLTQ